MTGQEVRLPLPIPIYAQAPPETLAVVQTFLAETALSEGVLMTLVDHAGEPHDPPGLVLQTDDSDRQPGAYELKVSQQHARLTASSPSGLLYGLHTFLQLCRVQSGQVVLPGVDIVDQPRFVWRGMHLDVSRHFFPVSFVKKFIDLLARHKMNVFHWHLCDDQGWRIEIPAFPRLTEIGGWRMEAGERYGGYYRQSEIREVITYAQKRCVTVIPEIEMPGHAMAALAAYPEYSCAGGPFDVPTTWGVFEDVYCAGSDKTLAFLEAILSEAATLFPAPMVHIGGDECPKARWRAHALCQERLRQEGLRNEDQLQAYFIARIAAHLDTLQKRLIGWDEILEGGAPPGSAIMAWRGVDKGTQAALAGHDVVMCPMSHCYFDHYQGEPCGEPRAIGGFTPLDKVYAFEPIPADLPRDLHARILGAQGNVWTEYMPDSRHVEYMALPRLCALAEVLWSPLAVRSWDDFSARLGTHVRRLDRLDVNYRRGGF
jgi:hexosaminidase